MLPATDTHMDHIDKGTMAGQFVKFFNPIDLQIVYLNSSNLGVAPAGTHKFNLKWTVQFPSNDGGAWFFGNNDFPTDTLALNITDTGVTVSGNRTGTGNIFSASWLVKDVGQGNATTFEIRYDDTIGLIQCFQDNVLLPLNSHTLGIAGAITFPNSTYFLGYEIGTFSLCASDFTLYIDTAVPNGKPLIALSTSTTADAYGLNPNGSSGVWTPNGTVTLCGANPEQPLYSIGIGCWPCHATAQGTR